MACGTAVLAFAVGGIPELVRSGETGYLAASGDTDALARGVDWLLSDDERRERLGRAAAAEIARNYQLRTQAERYHALYLELLAGRRS